MKLPLHFSVRGISIAILALLALGVGYRYFSTRAPHVESMVVKPVDFEQKISISGKVTPVHSVDLGFTQSGRVASVRVAVGDKVAAGDVLAAIDSSDLTALLAQKQAALDAQEAKLVALQQGTRPEQLAVARSAVANATTALAQSEQSVSDSIQNAYIKSDDAIRNKLYQFITNPRSSNPQLTFYTSDSQSSQDVLSGIVAIEAELNAWQAELSDLSAANAMQHSAAAQVHLGNVSALLTKASALLNHALSNSTVSQSQIDSYTVNIATARGNVNTVLSALTAAVSAQQSAAAALDTANKNLALQEAGTVQADIDAQAAQVEASKADVENVRAQIARTLISAPFSGVVTDVPAKVGSIAQPNVTQISLISQGALQIEVYVPEVNIASLAVGNHATVTLDAYGPDVPFPATVISVDPAETIRDGISTYKTTLQFATQDPRIRSGMTANTEITTSVIPDALAIPEGAVYRKDGSTYVQVKEGDSIVERAVTEGAFSGIGDVQIKDGLQVGDEVILNPSH